VFTGHKGGPLGNSWFSSQWKEAREYVGLPDLHLNDLRHLAGTLAAMTGATTREVMERLGHTTLETAMRYQHATRERNRVLADALDDLIVGSLPEERRRYVEVKYG
jgi:integrase